MPRQHISTEWKNADGAFHKPRRLHLEKDNTSLFPSLVQRLVANTRVSVVRKHVKTKNLWHIYFDMKPSVTNGIDTKVKVKDIPRRQRCRVVGRPFSAWLQSTTGGEKKAKQAEISVTRAFKFLKYCCEQSGEDEQSLLSTVELVDYFLCSSKDFLERTFLTIWKPLGI